MAECRSSGVGNFLEYHSLPNPLKKERGVVSPRYEHTMFCWSPTILLRSFWATINPGELRLYGGEGVLQLYYRFVAGSLAARQHPCLLSSNTCSARNSNKPAKDDHSATNCQQRSFQSCNSKALSTSSKNVRCNDVRLTRHITLSQSQQRQQQPPIPTLTEKTQRWELTTLNPKPHILKKRAGSIFHAETSMVTLPGNPHLTVPAPSLNTACTAMTMNSNSTWQDFSGSNKLSSNGPQMNMFTSSEKHMQQCTTTVISAKTGFQPHSTHQIGATDQNRNTLPAILLPVHY